MSVRTMARVWEYSQHAGTELLMLLAIADFSDDDGKAYPAVPTLARKCRMKDRNCRYILRTLEGSGELSILTNAGPHGANLYRINLDALGLQHSAGVQGIAGLQHSAVTPAMDCRKPLQPIAAKPSVNHQGTTREVKRSPKGSRLPTNWQLSDEFQQWAINEFGWSPEQCQRVSELFRDYWIAIPGSKGSKTDWLATWKNWCRRERDVRKPSAAKKQFTKSDYSKGLNHDGTF